jgi:hypothetical protein
MPPKRIPTQKQIYDDVQRRRGAILRGLNPEDEQKSHETRLAERETRAREKISRMAEMSKFNAEQENIANDAINRINKSALDARININEKKKDAEQETRDIDLEKKRILENIEKRNRVAKEREEQINKNRLDVEDKINRNNLLVSGDKEFCKKWSDKITKSKFVMNKFDKDNDNDEVFNRLLQSHIDQIKELIMDAEARSSSFAKLRTLKLMEIDQQFIKYLEGDEYKSLMPSDKKLVRDTIQQLIINQMESLMIIICKPIKKILEPVPYPEIIEREKETSIPKPIVYPEEVIVPESVPKTIKEPVYFIPDIFDDTLDKIKEMNRIKQIHMEDDLRDSVVHDDRDDIYYQVYAKVKDTVETTTRLDDITKKVEKEYDSIIQQNVEAIGAAATRPVGSTISEQTKRQRVVNAVIAAIKRDFALEDDSPSQTGGKLFKKIVYKTYKNLFLLHKYKI